MTAQPINEMTADQRIKLAQTYIGATEKASAKVARVFAEIFHNSDWEEVNVTFATLFAVRFETQDRPLGKDARKELIELTPKATIAEHVIMTGVSRATVARLRKETGIVDADKSKAITDGLAAASEDGENAESDNSEEKAEKSAANAAKRIHKLLSELDDSQIVDLLKSLDSERLAAIADALNELLVPA